jgi:hypothetical protein
MDIYHAAECPAELFDVEPLTTVDVEGLKTLSDSLRELKQAINQVITPWRGNCAEQSTIPLGQNKILKTPFLVESVQSIHEWKSWTQLGHVQSFPSPWPLAFVFDSGYKESRLAYSSAWGEETLAALISGTDSHRWKTPNQYLHAGQIPHQTNNRQNASQNLIPKSAMGLKDKHGRT